MPTNSHTHTHTYKHAYQLSLSLSHTHIHAYQLSHTHTFLPTHTCSLIRRHQQKTQKKEAAKQENRTVNAVPQQPNNNPTQYNHPTAKGEILRFLVICFWPHFRVFVSFQAALLDSSGGHLRRCHGTRGVHLSEAACRNIHCNKTTNGGLRTCTIFFPYRQLRGCDLA